jgi:hypothetical protein
MYASITTLDLSILNVPARLVEVDKPVVRYMHPYSPYCSCSQPRPHNLSGTLLEVTCINSFRYVLKEAVDTTNGAVNTVNEGSVSSSSGTPSHRQHPITIHNGTRFLKNRRVWKRFNYGERPTQAIPTQVESKLFRGESRISGQLVKVATLKKYKS